MPKNRRAVICLPPDNPEAMTELVPMALQALAEREEKTVAEERTGELRFEEPYVLVRIMEDDGEDFHIEFEHAGFRDRDGAMEFLTELINNGKDA